MTDDDKRSTGDRLVDLELGQLDAQERAALERELEASTELRQRAQVEGELNRALARRLSRVPAPPGLETRIRAALDEVAAPAEVVPWYRRPFYGAVAAMILILIAAAPFVFERKDPLELVRQNALVVDHACDRAGRSLSDQRLCRAADHDNALKLEDGRYLLPTTDSDDRARARVAEREMRGHRVAVTGRIVDGAVRLQALDDLGLDGSLASAGPPVEALRIASFAR